VSRCGLNAKLDAMPKTTDKPTAKRQRGTMKRAAATGRAPRRKPLSLEDSVVKLAMTGKLAEAAASAIRAQKQAGLPVTFLEGNLVIKEHPDGRREILRTLKPAATYALPKGVARIPSANGRGA
jgi:hypothetical protein